MLLIRLTPDLFSQAVPQTVPWSFMKGWLMMPAIGRPLCATHTCRP
jgi:hypothetical protein